MNVKPLQAKDIAEKVLFGELFILDVRNETDYEEWKIEGKQISSINKPYFDLLDVVEHIVNELPREKEILVVCAKEGSSQFVAEQLLDEGFNNIYYLAGGMKAWSEYVKPVKVGDVQGGGSIYQFNRLGKGCLSYMVVSNGEAAVIDAVRTIKAYEDFAKENGATITNVMDTHLHADHISGGRKLAEKVGGTYWLPPKDAEEVVFSYEPLIEGSVITVGGTKIEIDALYSPGHTIGSTSFIVDDSYLLSGDILFVDSIGRPDLAGNAEDWVSDLRNTLYKRYKELSQELIVLPAHYSKISEMDENGIVSANLKQLFEVNVGLNIKDENEFRKIVTENLPPQPNAYQEIRQTNMGKIHPNVEEEREMEIGPNRCAVHDSL
ncbi:MULTISPECIES: MBL fold metallo-hydrolase [Bacillus]|uniref:Hydroxyacylglutathione hydrolase n=2 Tax=Bacillus cereus group TaxID=86661 RepID=R8QTJ6_BACCE|nr:MULTISPECIES: MBL fold metallo-hydrolase [Bacillus cereus group]EOP74365.1 hydroxyacylglutathione hydrolase [Bacillus cereus VD118]MBJ8092904.1 MBL fold metallo-hydrolase [Bacillus cereus]MCQ6357498.1 MBL fold metallo-hydrolase [Bacillus cereus]CAH2462170.1 Rhodanese Homology Domain [Bacillus mycoides KBAB4]SCB70839.1 Hydroxyacylglutathione hydrolase [Bacillus mycoides]